MINSNKETFIDENLLTDGPWQALERAVARLMLFTGYEDVRLVGRTGDGGADIVASKLSKRFLVQVKYRKFGNIGKDVIDETLRACHLYRAQVPIIATNRGFGTDILERQVSLHSDGIQLQLWDRYKLRDLSNKYAVNELAVNPAHGYQQKPISNIVDSFLSGDEFSGLVLMATGLGKTYVVASAIKTLLNNHPGKITKILVLAHTNELVYQLDRSFWPFLNKYQTTAVWNGYEKGGLSHAVITFACVDSVFNYLKITKELPEIYDLIVIDEAHHAGSKSYLDLIEISEVGTKNGPYLLGMTATPWRSDEHNIKTLFKNKLCSIDIIEGMSKGYLANVDYRMHVDNINWKHLNEVKGISPKALNRSLFISEWDDAVIDKLQATWKETAKPKAIVFCQTIEHAFTVMDKINSRGFTRASIIYSGSYLGKRMSQIDRSATLCDFHDGLLNIICVVDIFNEGIDVPDVNIIVFQRVTHSRKIFVQQLGRGLRIKDGKDKVIVLDFVSDIRRFAAGLELKDKLGRAHRYLNIGSPVRFVNIHGDDPKTENFLRQWLKDVSTIQDAGENDNVLKFPAEIIS